MPKGPQGQKRPADVIGAAVMVAKTGEIEEQSLDANGRQTCGVSTSRLADVRSCAPYRRGEGRYRTKKLNPPRKSADDEFHPRGTRARFLLYRGHGFDLHLIAQAPFPEHRWWWNWGRKTALLRERTDQCTADPGGPLYEPAPEANRGVRGSAASAGDL
jgi:hypothetical protein